MSGDLVLIPRGLITTPNERGLAPKGAMRRAKNVVLRRAGIVEPRPGFQVGNVGAAPAGFDQRAIISWQNITLVVGYHASGWRAYFTTGAVQIAGEWTPPDPSRLRIKHAIARGAMYYTSMQGVRRLETNGSTASEAAGIPPPRICVRVATSSAGVAVPDDSAVAYRVVLKRRDANGYEERSIPSQRAYFRTTGAGVRNPTVQIDSLVGGRVGDVIEVYRSRPVSPFTATPDDELFFVAQRVLDSTDVTNLATSNTVTTDIVDSTPDGGGGAALYTNPSQETLLGGNRAPPFCRDIVEFKRSTFYLRTKSRPYVKFDLVDLGGNTAEGFFSNTGLQSRTFTGDVLVGDNKITNVASSTGLAPGMVIGDGTGNSPFVNGTRLLANTKIVSITGAGPFTVNINTVIQATAVGSSYTAGDVITINGVDLYAGFALPGFPGFAVRGALAGTTASQQLGETAEQLAAAINAELLDLYAYAEGLDGGGQQSVIIEHVGSYAGTIALSTTRAAAFSPALTSLAAITDEQPAGLAWSKADRPQAVPIAQTTVCGDLSEPILRGVATRDALYIFKPDGIFRLTGAGAASGWSIDLIAPGIVLLAPDSCAVLDDAVYCWTNEGVVAVTEAGVRRISSQAIGELLYGFERDLGVVPSQAHVPVGVANRKDSEYLLAVGPVAAGDGSSDTPCTTVYVWNTDTEAWTEWSLTPQHMIAADVGDLLTYITGAWGARVERSDETVIADGEFAITVALVVGVFITIAGGSGWIPVEGDVVKQGSAIARVREVASATTFTVEPPTVALTAGAATAYVAFESDLEFTAQMARGPGFAKVWGPVQWFFRSALQLYRMTLEYTSDLSAVSDKADVTPVAEAVERSLPVRSWVPRAHSWSANLYPRLRITNALARWAFEGVEIEAEADSTATRRTYGS